MARNGNTSTLSPLLLGIGRPISAADLLEVTQMMNYAYQSNSQTHVNLVTGNDGWGESGNEIATHEAQVDTSTWRQYYEFRIYLTEDIDYLVVGCQMDRGTGDDLEMRITVGAATSVTFGPWNGSSFVTREWDEQSITPNSGDVPGWTNVFVEAQKAAGSASNNDGFITAFYIENFVKATPAPPSDE